jgi:O-antigen/teichoic acid export membrane protein
MSPNVAKNTLYLTVASVGQKLLAFAYFVLLARTMGAERTGEYFLALSVTAIFSTITDFGLTPVVIRDVAKRPAEAVELVRRALSFKVPFMLAGAAGSVAAAWALGYDSTVRELVLIASLVMLADAVSLLLYGLLRGRQALQYESLGIFVGQSMTLALGGAALLFNPSLRMLVLALLAGSAFNMAFSAWHAVRLFGAAVLRPRVDLGSAKALLAAAAPFALAGIFVKVYSYVDTIFISKMIGTAAVGVYALAYKFTYSFQFLPMAFVAALYPGMSALVDRDAAGLRKLFDDAVWYTAVIAMPIAFGLFAVAPDAVSLAGGGYDGAVPVLRTLVFVLIPIFLDFPVGSLLSAADRQGTKTAVMGATMVLNVLLNAILIPVHGVIGAAYAALVSFAFLLAGGLAFVPRIIEGYRLADFLRTVVPIFVSGGVMGAVALWIRPSVGFASTILLAAAAYGAMLAATGSLRASHARRAFALIRRKPTYAESTAVHD